ARLVDPHGLTVGFPLNDLVVNQVVDSSTSLPNVQPRSLHVPGPAPGVHRLVMESDGSGPYTVRVSLSLDATPLFEREWTGAASPGERLVADLAIDAANGAPAAARLDEPRPLSGEPPGRFIYP